MWNACVQKRHETGCIVCRVASWTATHLPIKLLLVILPRQLERPHMLRDEVVQRRVSLAVGGAASLVIMQQPRQGAALRVLGTRRLRRLFNLLRMVLGYPPPVGVCDCV